MGEKVPGLVQVWLLEATVGHQHQQQVLAPPCAQLLLLGSRWASVLDASTNPVLQCRALWLPLPPPLCLQAKECGPSPTAWLLFMASCAVQKQREVGLPLHCVGKHQQLLPGPAEGGICSRQELVPWLRAEGCSQSTHRPVPYEMIQLRG